MPIERGFHYRSISILLPSVGNRLRLCKRWESMWMRMRIKGAVVKVGNICIFFCYFFFHSLSGLGRA